MAKINRTQRFLGVWQVPSSLRLEPIRLATGNAVELTAGATIPATGVTVLNGSGQHVIRGFLAGDKLSFSIVQRLWRLTPASGAFHTIGLCMLDASNLSSIMPCSYSFVDVHEVQANFQMQVKENHLRRRQKRSQACLQRSGRKEARGRRQRRGRLSRRLTRRQVSSYSALKCFTSCLFAYLHRHAHPINVIKGTQMICN